MEITTLEQKIYKLFINSDYKCLSEYANSIESDWLIKDYSPKILATQLSKIKQECLNYINFLLLDNPNDPSEYTHSLIKSKNVGDLRRCIELIDYYSRYYLKIEHTKSKK